MLDHANLDWTLNSFLDAFEARPVGLRVVSYLPMAHVAERTVSHYNGIASALEVTTCPDPGLLVPYLVETRPQFFFAVPRVWEKAHAALRAAVNADPERAAQLEQALEVGWQKAEADARGEPVPDAFEELWSIVGPALEGVRAQIGLDQCEIAMTGAAPIPFEILKFFRSLGVPLSEIYGLSETSGPMTWTPYRVKVGTVGPAIPRSEVALADDGEVLARGGNIFRGYLDAPEKTAEVFDEEGWFHTGDIGELDDDGYLKIVDRKKELIITAGGKNISPANLEAALKAGALIGQACVIGDNRPFVSALLVLDPEATPAWAKARDIAVDGLDALAVDPAVLAEVEREVDEANERFSQVEKIKRLDASRRRVASRLRGAHADDEVETSRRAPQVRGGDRSALQLSVVPLRRLGLRVAVGEREVGDLVHDVGDSVVLGREHPRDAGSFERGPIGIGDYPADDDRRSHADILQHAQRLRHEIEVRTREDREADHVDVLVARWPRRSAPG